MAKNCNLGNVYCFFSNRSLKVGWQFSISWVICIEFTFKNSRINNCNISEIRFPFCYRKTSNPYTLLMKIRTLALFVFGQWEIRDTWRNIFWFTPAKNPLFVPIVPLPVTLKVTGDVTLGNNMLVLLLLFEFDNRNPKFENQNSKIEKSKIEMGVVEIFKKEMKYMMICFSIEKKIGFFFSPFDFLLFFQENFNFHLYLPQ